MRVIRLENTKLQVEILPEFGGKIGSIFYKEQQFEFVASNTREGYEKADITTAFSERDASGIDDVFPSFEKERVEIEGRQLSYTDHGEIWRSSFQVMECSSCEVVLFYSSEEMHYHYTKKIALDENEVIISYSIENRKNESLPCIWGFHGLFRYEHDMRFFYPQDTETFINVYESEELGEVGTRYEMSNDQYDFTKVTSIHQNSAVKYYVDGVVNEGKCGYCYPTQKMMCELSYDKKVLPFLGVWITAGGFRGDYNCALEPTNGFYDTVQRAYENRKIYYLSKLEPLVFDMKITCKKMKN